MAYKPTPGRLQPSKYSFESAITINRKERSVTRGRAPWKFLFLVVSISSTDRRPDEVQTSLTLLYFCVDLIDALHFLRILFYKCFRVFFKSLVRYRSRRSPSTLFCTQKNAWSTKNAAGCPLPTIAHLAGSNSVAKQVPPLAAAGRSSWLQAPSQQHRQSAQPHRPRLHCYTVQFPRTRSWQL